MAKFNIGEGLKNYTKALEELAASANGMMKSAVYDGAGVCADSVRKEVMAIPNSHSNDSIRNAIADGIGIAKIKTDAYGGVYTKIGINGYIRDKKYNKNPQGFPASYMANIINKGVPGKMAAYPWINKAFRNAEATANKAMAAKIEELIDKKMKK